MKTAPLTIDTAQALVDASAKWSNFKGSTVIAILEMSGAFLVKFPNGRTWTLYADVMRERNDAMPS